MELTLKFANCARKVKNRSIVNKVLGREEVKKKLKVMQRENELKKKLSSGSNLTEESRREFEKQITQKEARQSELEAKIRSLEQFIINPRHACAERVTVVVSCVCVSVCLSVCPHTLFWQYVPLKV